MAGLNWALRVLIENGSWDFWKKKQLNIGVYFCSSQTPLKYQGIFFCKGLNPQGWGEWDWKQAEENAGSWKVKGLGGLEKQNLEWAVGQPRPSLVYINELPKGLGIGNIKYFWE